MAVRPDKVGLTDRIGILEGGSIAFRLVSELIATEPALSNNSGLSISISSGSATVFTGNTMFALLDSVPVIGLAGTVNAVDSMGTGRKAKVVWTVALALARPNRDTLDSPFLGDGAIVYGEAGGARLDMATVARGVSVAAGVGIEEEVPNLGGGEWVGEVLVIVTAES